MKLYICEDVKNAKWRKNIPDEQKISRAFIKKCICDFICEKEDNIDITFAKNDYGKPYIDSLYKIRENDRIKIDFSLFFSLSHSENMIICAVACFNVGADCQMKNVKNEAQCRKIAKRFYSSTENMFLESIDLYNSDGSDDLYDADDSDDFANSEAYINNFFKIWTKKEAYIKYTGKGLTEGMTTFSVTNEVRQKNYLGDVYFKRILPTKLRKLKRKDLYIYLCYNKENKNILSIKYFG
ncbi:MAG: 4'-phosphopantetheinyl transferase superfamily protein [Oscillospiraceae bacterium]|nr:4'-phosphopantetheinyl transferase superfamily protein [Oscillospiraceae bacterium]